MRGLVNWLRMLYWRNKLLFILAVVGILVLVAGCSTQGAAPPSGPYGGGC